MLPAGPAIPHAHGQRLQRLELWFVLWALAGFALCMFDGLASWVSIAGVLMMSQAFCAAVFRRRYQIVRNAVIPDFLTMFLLFKLTNDVITLLSVLVQHSRFAVSESIQQAGLVTYHDFYVADLYQTQAELAFLAGTIIVATVWILLERRHVVALWHEPRPKFVWIAYIVAGIAYFVLPATVLGQTYSLMKFFALGALGVLLGGQSRYAFGRRYSLVVYTAGLPFLLAAFRSGMKGEVLIAMLPALLPLIRRVTAPRAATLALFLAFVLLFIFPFAAVWRQANWTPAYAQPEHIGFPEASRRVFEEWSSNGVVDTSLTSTAQWLSRASSANAGGLVMQLAHQNGYIGPQTVKGLATIWVPRFLWPSKPHYAPGAWFTWYLGNASSPAAATTATAMLLPTELYFSFGPMGILMGMVLITAICFFAWTRLLRWSKRSVIPMVALYALLIQGTQLEGTFAIYAVSAPLILLVYVAAFQYVAKVVHGKRRIAVPASIHQRG